MVFILFAAYAIAYYVKLHYLNKEFFKKLEEYYAIQYTTRNVPIELDYYKQ